MTKTIPEIDDLIQGINNPELSLDSKQQERTGNEPTATDTQYKQVEDNTFPDTDKCWEDFLANLEKSDSREGREERLVCKIDRDLADSLDDCDIHNRCRSDLVNAIVRAFFGTYLPRLANYRREKKSLFTNYR